MTSNESVPNEVVVELLLLLLLFGGEDGESVGEVAGG